MVQTTAAAEPAGGPDHIAAKAQPRAGRCAHDRRRAGGVAGRRETGTPAVIRDAVHRFTIFIPAVGDAGMPLSAAKAGITATGLTVPGEITARVVAARVEDHARPTATTSR
jgi:hypothetical protein